MYAVPKFTTFVATAGKQCQYWILKSTIYRQIWYRVSQESISDQNQVMRLLPCVNKINRLTRLDNLACVIPQIMHLIARRRLSLDGSRYTTMCCLGY
jgi:hypothetical protein